MKSERTATEDERGESKRMACNEYYILCRRFASESVGPRTYRAVYVKIAYCIAAVALAIPRALLHSASPRSANSHSLSLAYRRYAVIYYYSEDDLHRLSQSSSMFANGTFDVSLPLLILTCGS